MVGLDITPQFIPNSIYIPVQLSAYSLSVATTVLSTMIIVIRILMVSRMPGATDQPRIAMEIIVESALLYSISALVYTPMVAYWSLTTAPAVYSQYAELFFVYMAVESIHHSSSSSGSNSTSQNFAPALIMLRVVLGRACPATKWSVKISGLQFNSVPGVKESARSRGTTSTILTVPRNHHGEEVDLGLNQEPRTEPLDVEEGTGRMDEGSTRIWDALRKQTIKVCYSCIWGWYLLMVTVFIG
jgi:hypothetical protein